MWNRFFLLNKRFCSYLVNGSHFNFKNTISNKITVENTQTNILRLIKQKITNAYDKLSKPDINIDIFPSSIDKYNEYCHKMIKSQIKYSKHCINENEDILVQNSLITNLEIKEFDFVPFQNKKLRLYYNLPEDVRNQHFFQNDQSNIFKQHYYAFIKRNNFKLSPNILIVYHFEGLTEEIIKTILEEYKINRIDPPCTPTGYWLVYAGDKHSHTKMISNLFKHENQYLKIQPYYQSANIYPIGRKSKNIIEIYSKSEKLSDIDKLMKALNIKDAISYYNNVNKGYLYTIFCNNLNEYESVIYRNGLPLNGTNDYIMSFGDKLSLNNIAHPYINFNFPPEYKLEAIEKLKNYKFEILQNEYSAIIYPRNQNELDRLNEGIEIKGETFFINANRIFDIKVKDAICFPKPENQIDDNNLIKSNFGLITPLSFVENSGKKIVSFKSEDYFKAFFQSETNLNNKLEFYSDYIKFINHYGCLLPGYLAINTKREDFHNIKFTFNFRFVKGKENEIKPIIEVKFEDFQKYAYQKLEIDGHLIELEPLFVPIDKEITFLTCNKSNFYFYNILRANNIFCTIEEEKSLIYPQFKNLDQFRQFIILWSEWNLSKKGHSDLFYGNDIHHL